MPPPARFAARLAARAEFDATVAWALGVRFWQIVAAPITALLIADRFSETEQDYYYTIAGLLGLDALCRLGLSEVLVALTAHAFADDTVGSSARRLTGLTRFAGRWAALSSAAFAVGVGAFGAWSLSGADVASGLKAAWAGPWWTAAVCTAGSVAVAPALAVLTGCGQVGPVTRTQTLAAVAANVGAWAVMLFGGSLWAVAAACAGRLAIEAALIVRSWPLLRTLAGDDAAAFCWRVDVWPMQWRAAVQSSAAAAAAAGLTLVLFRHRDLLGAGEAGRLGMSWSAALALQYGGTAWLNTRAPRLGALAAKQDRAGFDCLFARTFLASWAAVAAGAVAGTALVWALNLWGVPLAERLLPPAAFGALVAGSVALHVPLSLAGYLRAWRAEAFVAPAVGMWAAVGLATWTLGPRYGAIGVAWGFSGAIMLVGVPLYALRWRAVVRRLPAAAAPLRRPTA
ncbi:hypothetical protein [Alienimonas californiensis]|uniref:Polysaccharide biosynthesis protein n=1 Tax=Alienimonas californiensis TaxID=2527989 RepID=A0A517PE57_9PLAN|nr:hypothetical protein [Alienimonas californiensis]QDT17649.1 hypothetical protein CA12_37790 [Alienimonas californiensis]